MFLYWFKFAEVLRQHSTPPTAEDLVAIEDGNLIVVYLKDGKFVSYPKMAPITEAEVLDIAGPESETPQPTHVYTGESIV